MDSKEPLQEILEWMRQLNKSTGAIQDSQEKLAHQMELMEKKINIRINGVDERVEHFTDKTRFEKEIQRIKQEIRELMH